MTSMRRFGLYAAVTLYVCGLSAAAAAERFGQWSLEQPEDSFSRCPLNGGGLKGSTQHFILEGRDGVDAMERGYVRGFDAVAKAEL